MTKNYCENRAESIRNHHEVANCNVIYAEAIDYQIVQVLVNAHHSSIDKNSKNYNPKYFWQLK